MSVTHPNTYIASSLLPGTLVNPKKKIGRKMKGSKNPTLKREDGQTV